MSYTPPDWDAADLSWSGEAAYTPPDWDAADLSFSPDLPQATLLGAGLLGAPRVVAGQFVSAFLQSPGILGAPVLTANPRTVVWVQGVGLLGAPRLLGEATGTEATLQGTGLLGAPHATVWTGWRAWLVSPGILGAPRLRAKPRTLATLLGSGLLGAPQARLWGLPATAAVIPPGVTRYFCLLTGAPDGLADALLPISNFSVRHRPDAPSYYSITIPSYAYVGDLTARPNGEIVIWSEKSGVSEELARGDLGQVSIARGPNSQSISISGNADRAELPHLTYVFDEALYVSTTFAGDSRLRIEPRARIRPGDYVRYQDVNFAVGEVTWSVAVSAGGMAVTMELASVPLEDGGDFYANSEAQIMGAGLLGAPQAVASRTIDEDEMLSEFITLVTTGTTTTRQVSLAAGTYEVHLLESDPNVGDLDLYVKLDIPPTTIVYDCRSNSAVSDEYCEVTTAEAAVLHILIRATEAPGTFHLLVLRQAPPPPSELPIDAEVVLEVADPYLFSVPVTAGTYQLDLSDPDGVSGVGAGLVVRFGLPPDTSYDCIGFAVPTPAQCVVTTAIETTLYYSLFYLAEPVTARIRVAKTA